MSSGVILGLWIFWFITLLVLYHKVFVVFYFSLDGIVKELAVTAFLSIIMVGITVYLWWVAAIIIILFGLSLWKKIGSIVPLVIAIIIAIVISIAGIENRKSVDEELNSGNRSARHSVDYEENMYLL